MWFLNGCNPINQSHAFNWTGSSSNPHPWVDVECGCGSFVMEAGTSKIVPSKTLKDSMRQAEQLALTNDRP